MATVRVILKACLTLLIVSALPLINLSEVSSSATSSEPEVRTTITYCNFDLAKQWRLRNLSFNSLYSFVIDKEGKPLDLKKVRDNFIGEQAVRDCVSTWRMVGFSENSRFSVYFVWKHDRGWVRQEISGNGFSQVMTMSSLGIDQLRPPNGRKD